MKEIGKQITRNIGLDHANNLRSAVYLIPKAPKTIVGNEWISLNAHVSMIKLDYLRKIKMTDKEQAENCLRRAEEMLKKDNSVLGWMGSLFSSRGAETADEASELFRKAGSRFRVAEMWKDAADAYLRASELSRRCSTDPGPTDDIEAAQCLRKVDPRRSAELYASAAEWYIDKGRLSIAARHLATAAEVTEVELASPTESVPLYEKAASLYSGENSKSSANKLWLKVAHHAALQTDYPKAIRLYEKIAEDCLGNNLLRLSAIEYFFKASLVALCYDMLEAQRAFHKYGVQSSSFKESRQGELIKEIIRSAEEGNVQIFDDAVKKYDSIVHLDEFTSTLLLRIKAPIENLFDIT